MKITVTIEAKFDENEGNFDIRLAATPRPEELSVYARNIRALLLFAETEGINNVFKKLECETETEITK